MIITWKQFFQHNLHQCWCTYPIVLSAPQIQLHNILWVAVSSTVGLRVERRYHLQSVCHQAVVLEDQTDEKSGWSVLQHPLYSPDLAPTRLLICLVH
ncbi:hypothetical protein AVEN_208222-1 [Araneus ventricosus]|uniref:Uncharacterized protein n=1 Tax=Araneus ventricosus TaxID=182803 RepID=A0A4Y2RSQ0_ARAVE|nr:hypothetical protein AVEN_208222-1 [Araneus ventricosus]